ncbi:MAG TPA: ComEC/Rec2 family competence protein [Chthoniobacterales bacterium]|nr:ComEC/Rec2 family competence protein [Chthoniobacterales bacterium]
MKPPIAWPRQPFLGIALAAVSGILVADNWPRHSLGVLGAFATLTVFGWISGRSLAVYASVAFAFYLLHSLATTDSPGMQLARGLGDDPRPATIQGAIISEPRLSQRGTSSFLLAVETIEIDGEARQCRAKLLARWRHPVEFGDEVRLFGTLEKIAGPRNPGEFDMRSYLQRQDVHRALIVRYPENGVVVRRGGGDRIQRAAQKSRGWMQRVINRGLESSADVTGAINGMVLGLRHQTPEDIEEPFQQTGTLHLFAVAGLHVGIVARLLWILATVARLPRKWATILIIPALLFYAAITGLHTSSVRAAVMSAVLLGGFIVERKAFAFNSLAAAATLILWWNTNELFAVGFQLSFCVVGAILWLHEPTFAFLRRRLAPDPFLPRTLFTIRRRTLQSALTWVAGAGSVSFAAWVGSLPLMYWYYHLVTLTSLVANLVVVPIAFFVLAGALLSLVAAPFSTWLSVIFNNANWALTKLILGAVHLFAQVPGGHFYVEHAHRATGARLEVNVLDLRSGAAVHVRAGNRDWLFDAGPARDYERVVCSYLRARGIDRLDGLVLTHGDAGHLGGAKALVLDFRPHHLIDSGGEDRSLFHRNLLEWLAAQKRFVWFCHAGNEFEIGRDVTARILFPPPHFRANRSDDQALVAQLFVSGKPRVLLMSDSGIPTEQALLRDFPDLRGNVIIKGQHHSGVSGSDELLDRIRPEAVVATSRDFPENERLKDEWVDGLRGRKIKLLRQDETGAVQLRFFRVRWESESYVTGEIFRSESR